MTDGRLDVVFFPTRTRRGLLGWIARCARGTHLGHPRLVYEQGRTVEWRCREARPFQVDGDPPDPAANGDPATAACVRISLSPSILPVLLP